MPEQPRGAGGRYVKPDGSQTAAAPAAAAGIAAASAADNAADLRRQRDELAERVKAAEGKNCPSCGCTLIAGKLRPAADQKPAAQPAASSGTPAAEKPAPAAPPKERTHLDILGGG